MRHKLSFLVFFLTLVFGLLFVAPSLGQAAADEKGAGEKAKPADKADARSARDDKDDKVAQATQPYLGVGAVEMHPALTHHLPNVIGKGRGVLIANVMKGSPADRAGLKVHDILVSYDQQDVYSPEQLVKLVRNDKPGREVAISFVRGGKMSEARVELAEMPMPEASSRRTTFRLPLEELLPFTQPEPVGKRTAGGTENRTPWTTFQSLTLRKLEDGTYKAEIEYRNADKKVIHRDYAGTREEIRDAIKNDKELPADEREHLLRSLDQQPSALEVFPDAFRNFTWDREAFNWPELFDF